MGRRRRAAAIASPSRVCAFSRARSLPSSASKVARSTAAGGLGALVALAAAGVGDETDPAAQQPELDDVGPLPFADSSFMTVSSHLFLVVPATVPVRRAASEDVPNVAEFL
jgi:hypothetical protein